MCFFIHFLGGQFFDGFPSLDNPMDPSTVQKKKSSWQNVFFYSFLGRAIFWWFSLPGQPNGPLHCPKKKKVHDKMCFFSFLGRAIFWWVSLPGQPNWPLHCPKKKKSSWQNVVFFSILGSNFLMVFPPWTTQWTPPLSPKKKGSWQNVFFFSFLGGQFFDGFPSLDNPMDPSTVQKKKFMTTSVFFISWEGNFLMVFPPWTTQWTPPLSKKKKCSWQNVFFSFLGREFFRQGMGRMCAVSVGSHPCHAQSCDWLRRLTCSHASGRPRRNSLVVWRWSCEWPRYGEPLVWPFLSFLVAFRSTLICGWSFLIVFDGPRVSSFLTVFDRFWWVPCGLECTSEGSALGRLLAPSALGVTGWQWVEEATALPRVGLLDGPDCRGRVWTSAHCSCYPLPIANPGHLQHYFCGNPRETRAMPNALLGSTEFFPKNMFFVTCPETDL